MTRTHFHNVQAENVLDFLAERIKEYEAYFGEIPTSEKFESKKKEYLRSKGPVDLEI